MHSQKEMSFIYLIPYLITELSTSHKSNGFALAVDVDEIIKINIKE